MIKERVLQCRMSEIGRIKIGGLEDRVRRTSSGKEWQAPVKYEHFVVTTMERDKSGNFVKDEAIHSVIGDSPRELGIRLLYNDLELNFRTELAYYQGKTCLCRGDGEVAQRLDKETGELLEAKDEGVKVGNIIYYAEEVPCKYNYNLVPIFVQTQELIGRPPYEIMAFSCKDFDDLVKATTDKVVKKALKQLKTDHRTLKSLRVKITPKPAEAIKAIENNTEGADE